LYGNFKNIVLVTSYPDISLNYSGMNIDQETDMGTAFAYGFGGGVIINNINLALRYYSGEPEFTQTASYGGLEQKAKVKLSITNLELLIGIRL